VPASTPEPPSLSLASKWTVASLLFHSSAFGAGVIVCVTVGAMLSYLSDTAFGGSAFPALSIAKNVTVASPLPSSGTLMLLLAPAAACSAPPLTL
jgi:hypothetical protein